MYSAASTLFTGSVVVLAMYTFYKLGYNPLDPYSWPIPQVDWFFDGIRQYYSKVAQQNPEGLPIAVGVFTWFSQFILAFIAKHTEWVKSNTIRELLGGLFTGEWIKAVLPVKEEKVSKPKVPTISIQE